MHKITWLKRWYLIADQRLVLKSATNQVMVVFQQHTIIFTKIKFCFKVDYADYHISGSYACRPVSVTYLLNVKKTRKNLQTWCCPLHTKSYTISTAAEALKIVHFSLCDSPTLLCAYSTSQISAIIHHLVITSSFCARGQHKNITCWRPKTLWNSTSKSSLSKQGASLFVSACHPPNFRSFRIIYYLFSHHSFCSTKYSLRVTVLKIQLYCLWRQQQYFPLLSTYFMCTDVHFATEENSYQLGEQMREKHPQTRYPAKCHSLVAAVTFLPLLPNPFFLSCMKSCMLQQPSLNGRCSVWSFCNSPSPKTQNPNPQSIRELSLLSMKWYHIQARSC